MILRKLKAATTLATLLTVLFVGAVLITPSPVQAGRCSAKKETKSCDKSESSDEKKDDEKKDDEKKSCDKSESSGEKKGCDKSEK